MLRFPDADLFGTLLRTCPEGAENVILGDGERVSERRRGTECECEEDESEECASAREKASLAGNVMELYMHR